MNIKLLGNRVVVELEKKEEKTAGGFVVSKTVEQGDIMTGKIVAVGRGTKDEDGNFQSIEIKEGEKVLFQYGTSILLEGKSYLLVNEADVIAII